MWDMILKRLMMAEACGGAVTFHQCAVNPITDANPVFERLDMDVASAHLDRFLIIRLTSGSPGAIVIGFAPRRRRCPISVSVKSIAVSVNSCSIESADSPST